MDENKIVVVDSIMGSGKTSWAIDYMNNNKDKKFIYITPYLSEIDRIKEKCNSRRFYDPINIGKGKLDSFNRLLLQGKDIASTHALFRSSTEETRKLIESNGYTLILDEVMSVVQPVEKKKDDLVVMLDADLIRIEDNGLITWNEEKIDYESSFDDVKYMCENNCLFIVNNCLFMWTFPVKVFNSFENIYILTYMFKGQLQRTYYDLYNVGYTYKSVSNESGKYELVDYIEKYDMSKIKSLIEVLDDNKLNSIGDGEFSLSKTWFSKNNTLVEQLQKNIYNYFKRKVCSKINDNMWCTFKDYKGKLSGKGYTKGFVSLGTRATNEYVDKSCMAYCANVFVNPMIVHFFKQHNVDVDEELYALSELLQWLWRSRIRRGENVKLYIPSERMRGLLLEWLK